MAFIYYIFIFALVLLAIFTTCRIIGKVCSAEYNFNKFIETKNKKYGARALIYLAREPDDDAKRVKLLIDNGIDINTQTRKGNTALIEAAKNENTNIIEFLVKNGADLNIKNKKGHNALYEAAAKGFLYIYTYLKEQGADADNIPDNMALLFAADKDDFNTVKDLIAKGANVNFRTLPEGKTPLMIACENGYFDIIKLLVENGAKINISDFGKYTPLMYACVRKLFADINPSNIAKHFKKIKVKYKPFDIAKWLIENGADVNYQNPLISAVFFCPEDIDVIRLLAEKGANVNAVMPKEKGRSNGFTLLMFACEQGYVGIAKTLLQHGANMDLADAKGNTALSLAKETGNKKIIALLEEHAEFLKKEKAAQEKDQ